jgi:hypothetical protein
MLLLFYTLSYCLIQFLYVSLLNKILIMANGKSTWKYNKLLTARRNYYLPGGPLGIPSTNDSANITGAPTTAPTELISTGGMPTSVPKVKAALGLAGKAIKNTLNTPVASAGVAGIGQLAGTALSGGYDSGIGNATRAIGNAVSALPGGAVYGAAINAAGGLYNGLFGEKVNQEELNRVNNDIASLSSEASSISSANSFDDSSLYNTAAVKTTVDAYKGAVLNGSAAKKNAELANELITGVDTVNRTKENVINNIASGQFNNAVANFSAFGGELNTQGADFSNGLLYIDAGGSHESNPYEGVPMGVDQEGTPNLVEEGETIFNDYVFSRRLKVPKAIRNKYKLGGTITFAEASKKMAKESEERPNDPISIRGLEAMLKDLANAQEAIRNNNEGKEFAEGGNLYADGSTLKYYKDGIIPEDDALYNTYKDYLTNGIIDFDKLYAADSPWMQRRNQISTLLKDKDKSKGFREWYAAQLNDYNKDTKGYKPYSADDITEDLFNRWSSDRKLGFGHNVIYDEGVNQFITPRKTKDRRWLLGPKTDANGTPLDPYATAKEITEDYDSNTKKYSFENKKATSEGNIDYTDYYYNQATPDTSKIPRNWVKIKGADGKYGEAMLYDDARAQGLLEGYTRVDQDDKYGEDGKGNLGYYDPNEKDNYKVLPTWSRYIPSVALGISSITDAAELTNKPDYSNAEALLEASRGAGTYNPVKFKPIGNYLTYKPFDRDYYINKMNAEAGASRRLLANTSGGNRGTAMAGILAADNNYLNQLGTLARQAEEYNLAQRQQVEEFNRGTNITNSQGFLDAAKANQNAALQSRELALKGTMEGYAMREKARLASDAAKSANLSGFVTSLGDIGRENMAWNWRNFGLATDTFGPTDKRDEGKLLTHVASKGGKIKKKKGLTI